MKTMKTQKTTIVKRTGLIFSMVLSLSNYTKAQDYGTGDWSPWGAWNAAAQSAPCITGASPWALGGNVIITVGGTSNGNVATAPVTHNNIGTCNNYPFILKSNNVQSIFLLPNSYVGIGRNNALPGAALDVINTDPVNPANVSSFRIYGDLPGNLESTTDINMNFATGKTFNINEGAANAATNVMSIVGGYVGIGSQGNPLSKLEVRDVANTDVYSYATNSNGTAGLWALNGSTNYGLRIDGNGYGHISQNVNSPINMLNFYYNSSVSKSQVWVGKKPTTGSHTNFDFAAPKIVAEEMYVFTTSGTWADYVFAKDYKLPKLSDVEAYYKKNQHLPEIPSAEEVGANGINVAEMNKLLLQKVEELTIYLVEQQKQIDDLKKKNSN